MVITSLTKDGVQGENPFSVYCNMTDKEGIGVTVVSHDSENRSHVNGFEAPGNYSHDIQVIGASVSQLRTFARNFSNIDFFLKLLPLKDDELAMSEM